MKTVKDYIVQEKLVLKKNMSGISVKKTLFPNTLRELSIMIINEIKRNGINCSLNHIDTSKITSMSYLFRGNLPGISISDEQLLRSFNGDISEWDVSNVTEMVCMFAKSNFDGDLSGWDVSNVRNFGNMFCASKFTGKNGNIGKWKLNNAVRLHNMFKETKFNGDISEWTVSSVETFECMFQDNSEFNQPIGKWKLNSSKKICVWKMFDEATAFCQDLSSWDFSDIDLPDKYDIFHGAKNMKQEYLPQGIKTI